jgi:hypothetical protein
MSVVEAQHRVAAGGQLARPQHELAMAAHAVLRAATDDHEYAALGGFVAAMQDADQRRAFAVQHQGLLVHAATFAASQGVVM